MMLLIFTLCELCTEVCVVVRDGWRWKRNNGRVKGREGKCDGGGGRPDRSKGGGRGPGGLGEAVKWGER